ncbi:MAG: tRNA lysidine(34) synthetase TilS, partial [Planctomycetales bacterium]|nr:tRNA lysidine(34) synthetase TilS [Planctomycetales bacterium]
ILVAVSGGPDSVALLHLFTELKRSTSSDGIPLHVAHYNHGWRGEESQQDCEFVQNLAGQLGWECHVGPALSHPHGNDELSSTTEAGARAQRYAFLQDTAERLGARYLVTGHTADDQVETLLHRIIRGTGVSGLAGIPRTRVLSPALTVVRPLLDFSRDELLEYLDQHGFPYRDDHTNRDIQWTRNRIRHELLPLLRKNYNPQIDASLLRLGEVASAACRLTAEQLAPLQEQCVVQRQEDLVALVPGPLARALPYVRAEFFLSIWQEQEWPLQQMGQSQWTRLTEIVTRETAQEFFPGNICVTKTRDSLVLHRRAAMQANAPPPP